MKLYKAGISIIVVVVVCVFAVSGCQNASKEGVKPQSQVEKAAPAVVKPAPAVEKPAPVAEKPAPASGKPVPQVVTAAQNVPMVLKFVPGDTTKYKVVMEGQKKVEWEGKVPNDASFQNGQTTNTVEMTFTQKIQSVNNNGNAVAVIKIDALKYKSVLKQSAVLDFDSSRAEDANAPMAKLIGKSYTIELTPSGQVSQVVDVNGAMAAVKGNSSSQRAAMKLLEPEVIKDRHGSLCLPAADKNLISSGQGWKNTRTFSFGLMGPVSYDRVYTLKKVERAGNREIALAQMKAVPTAEAMEELSKGKMSNRIAKGFDNKGEYEGELKLDLSSGKVEKFTEEFKMEWLAAKPSSDVNAPEAEPTALKIIAERFYSIEKIE